MDNPTAAPSTLPRRVQLDLTVDELEMLMALATHGAMHALALFGPEGSACTTAVAGREIQRFGLGRWNAMGIRMLRLLRAAAPDVQLKVAIGPAPEGRQP